MIEYDVFVIYDGNEQHLLSRQRVTIFQEPSQSAAVVTQGYQYCTTSIHRLGAQWPLSSPPHWPCLQPIATLRRLDRDGHVDRLLYGRLRVPECSTRRRYRLL